MELARALVQMRTAWVTKLEEQWKSHVHIWAFLLAVVICGVAFGGIVAGILNDGDRLVISNALTSLLSTISQGQLASPTSLWTERMVSDGRLLLILWVLGLSVIGLPLIAVVLFLRGFSVGFSIGFTVLTFGWRGLWFSIAGIFAHQLLSFTAIVFAGGIAMRFSANLLRRSLPLHQIIPRVILYTIVFCLIMLPIAIGAAMQAFWAPDLISGILTHASPGGK